MKKSKFFWVYTIILFTVALVLIMMGFSMTNVKKDYKSQVQTLQTEKETLYSTNESLKIKVDELTKTVTELTAREEAYAAGVEKIYEADGLYDEGEYEKAKEVLDTVDPSILREKIRGRYDYVKGKIDSKVN